jgi:hypothetical protein
MKDAALGRAASRGTLQKGPTMTSYLLQQINAVTEITMGTLTLIAFMCSTGMYFIRPHLVIPALSIIFLPFFIVFSVVAYASLTLLEVFPLNKMDQWLICTILSATIGTIVGLIFVIAVSKCIDHIQARTTQTRAA